MYRRSKRLYGNSDGKLRDDRGDRDDRDRPDRTLLYPGDRDDRDRPDRTLLYPGDRDDRDRPDRTLLYPGDRDDRVKFTCDHMETVNRTDRLHTISSDRGHWGDYMETRLYTLSLPKVHVLAVSRS